MGLRSRITWLVAAATSAVVVAFLVPLCLLVRELAHDRVLDLAREQAQSVATLVATVDDLARLRAALDQPSGNVTTWVELPSGELLGPAAGKPNATLRQQVRADLRAVTVARDSGADVLVPVVTSNGPAIVQSSASYAVTDASVYAAWLSLSLAGLALLVGALLVAQRISERIATPVTDLADVAHRLRAGDLAARAEPAGPGEVAELGGALNRLADRIGELVAGEREAAADLSHRLRTPVTALRLDVDLVDEPELRARLQGRVDDLHRAIDRVLTDARRASRDALGGPSDAVQALRDVAAHWSPLAEDQQRRLTVDLPVITGPGGQVPVGLGAHDLRDLVDTLVDNVFAHTPEGVELSLGLRVTDHHALLSVDDAGPGVPDAVSAERGASGAGGTGLGLDIVRRLAESAGGAVTITRSPLGGIRVQAHLPLRQ